MRFNLFKPKQLNLNNGVEIACIKILDTKDNPLYKFKFRKSGWDEWTYFLMVDIDKSPIVF